MSLSTKNIAEPKDSKTFGPGMATAKINKIDLSTVSYKAGAYNVDIHVEGEDLGPEFEGFYIDAVAKEGERYKGQVGRIRLNQYPFSDGTTKTGREIKRDNTILAALATLADSVGKRAELDAIEADEIEDYVSQASDILSGDKFYNMCISGREYQAGEYTNYDLFFPRVNKGSVYIEDATTDAKDTKLVQFDVATNIVGKAPVKAIEGFEPEKAKDDFTL